MVMALPNLTKLAIGYIESDNKQISTGLLLLFSVLFLKFTQNLVESHLFMHFTLFGYNVSNSLSLCVFGKALRYPTLCSKEYQLAQLVSFSQVDAQRLTNLGYSTCVAIFFPIQLAVGVFLMYRFIGISFLAGIGVLVVMSLMIFLNSSLQAKTAERLLQTKDKRIKTTTEIFNNIRFIKSSAWEKYFLNKVSQDRKAELTQLRWTGFYKVIGTFFFWLTSPLILSMTFTVFLLRGEELTAEKAFTTIILFNILQFPISALPDSVAQLIQMWASMKRIGKFIYQPEMNRDYIRASCKESNAIEIQDGSFYWEL